MTKKPTTWPMILCGGLVGPVVHGGPAVEWGGPPELEDGSLVVELGPSDVATGGCECAPKSDK